MVEPLSMTTLTRLGVISALVVSIVVVRWLDRSRDWGQRRRKRLLLGVPWGTLVSVVLVLLVYLFVQSGYRHFDTPVTVAFRSWSYLYPLGMLLAPFAHNGPNHLAGNLFGTMVLGSLAEYAWGHFPPNRGSSAFSSFRTNPYARSFVLFPVGVGVVGLLTSLLSWGPIIGFSGVVFAFAGFALVRYPLGTVIAVSAEAVVGLVFLGVVDPVRVAEAQPQFVQPWWAGIAVQGHLLGLFLGILFGAMVLRRYEVEPSKLWAGTVMIAVSFSLWAIWWFRGNNEFVLYRGVGLIFVLALALLVTVASRGGTSRRSYLGVPSRHVGLLALAFPILVIGFVALPLNLTTVAEDSTLGASPQIEIRDYSVAYAENVTNGQTRVVNVSVGRETTNVVTSGVIIVSERRHVWSRAVATGRLAFQGNATVRLGSLGWQRAIEVRRVGWKVVGNSTSYRIQFRPAGESWRPAYRTPPIIAEPIVDGRRVAIVPTSEGFSIAVNDTTSISTVALPATNQSVRVAGLNITREERRLYASANETRVRIAERERYHPQ